jgi:acyl-ACP thioesterase
MAPFLPHKLRWPGGARWKPGSVAGSAGRRPAVGKNAGMDLLPPGFRTDPADGRVYAGRRIVRSTDVLPSGRLRLDALARYLQNVAEDDLADAGLAEPVVWLVRRCELTIQALPVMGEPLAIRTFCSATGPRWAERTTTIAGADGPLVQARAVWAAVSQADGRPVPLSGGFMRVYGAAAGGRTVSARLSHPRPSPDPGPAGGPGFAGGPGGRDWPLRAADFDTAGHVNNAVHWAVVEDVLAAAGWLPAVAELEYHRAIGPGCTPVLRTQLGEREASIWLLDGRRLLASARLARARPGVVGATGPRG